LFGSNVGPTISAEVEHLFLCSVVELY